ncbi:VOC family protein [Microbispora sp. GKU 823]|uniref:VOC family protein n=1 Tax=Microbispora sp. GKU 823 TaxID=1652100 RepID=UPI002117E5E1|nr:hypothetical protein [Microbispora sp. GKU 823]
MADADHLRAAARARRPADRRQPLLVLYTADLAVVAKRLRDHGVRVWDEREDPDSRSLHFADLYGNVVVVAQLLGA